MGLYINPQGMRKEEFLPLHGKMISKSEALALTDFTSDLPVILVDNYAFTAAVGYSPREIAAFFHPDDLRPKRCWILPRGTICEGAGITLEMLDKLTGK